MNHSDVKGVSIKGQFYISGQEQAHTRIKDIVNDREVHSLRQLSRVLLESMEVFKTVESTNPEVQTYETRLVVIKTDAYQETVKRSYDMMVSRGVPEVEAAMVVGLFESLIGINHD